MLLPGLLSLFRNRKPEPDSLPAKFARLLAFHEEMAITTRAAIADLKRTNQLGLLLDGAPEAAVLMARIAANWLKRRTNSFYRTSAPLQARHDVSNDLSVDWQLACIAKALGFTAPPPHDWRW